MKLNSVPSQEETPLLSGNLATGGKFSMIVLYHRYNMTFFQLFQHGNSQPTQVVQRNSGKINFSRSQNISHNFAINLIDGRLKYSIDIGFHT